MVWCGKKLQTVRSVSTLNCIENLIGDNKIGIILHWKPKTIQPALTQKQFLAMFTNPTLREQIYRHVDEKYEE